MIEQKNMENIISAMQDLNLIINQFKKQLNQNGNFSKIPVIEIDLALEKTRSLYSELLFLKNLETEFQVNSKTKIPIKKESVTEIIQKQSLIKEPEVELTAPKETIKIIEEKITEPLVPEIKEEVNKPLTGTVKEAVSLQPMESIIDVIFKQNKTEDFASKLQQKPITDINEAIGLGEKMLYINELFDKNPAKYTDSIKELNNFTFLDDAMAYINSNFSWNVEKEAVISFLEIVKRKFSV